MKKKVEFAIKSIIKQFLGNLLSLLIKRNKNIWLFGSLSGHGFIYSSKYLYMYLTESSQTQIKPVWVTKKISLVNELKSKGYEVYYKYSLKGLYYILKSKYYFVDCKLSDISMTFSQGAEIINLWHGIPLKKIEADIDAGKHKNSHKYNVIEEYFLKALQNQYEHYFISCGNYDKNIFVSAFKADKNKVSSLGSPRNDVLFKNFKDQDIFMEEKVKHIQSLKNQGKKILFYLPTYRDTGRNITEWLNSKKLHDVLKKNNAVLAFKLHPNDKNVINVESEELYKLSNKTDLYVLLKKMDCLITDYSSVYFDYLLLDRPIIFYPFDLEEYIAQDRPLYVDYDEYTPGRKAYNEDELINAIQLTINGEDNYKQARAKIRNEVFLHQDGNACERIVEFVKNLDK